MTPNEAKKIISSELNSRGASFTRLTAKTVDFTDLARAKCIFVRIYGWQPKSGEYDAVRTVAVKNGFRIEL